MNDEEDDGGLGEDEVTLVGLPCRDPLIQKLCAFARKEKMHKRLLDFMEQYSERFSSFDADEESSHELMTLFQKYEAIFEGYIEEFLSKEEEITPEAFYQHCQNVKEHDRDSYLNLKIVLSCLDFQSFTQMMREHTVIEQQASKMIDDMGL